MRALLVWFVLMFGAFPAWGATYHWLDGWKGATYSTSTTDSGAVCAAAASAIGSILVGGEAGASLSVTGCSGSATEVGQFISLSMHATGCGFCEFNVSGQTQTLQSIDDDEEEEEEPGEVVLDKSIVFVGAFVCGLIAFVGGKMR